MLNFLASAVEPSCGLRRTFGMASMPATSAMQQLAYVGEGERERERERERAREKQKKTKPFAQSILPQNRNSCTHTSV